MTDSEQLHLNWEKFDAKLKSSYAGLRETPDFSDVTLVCADGKQINAHKVILETTSSLLPDPRGAGHVEAFQFLSV